jgi:hypothetical protein
MVGENANVAADLSPYDGKWSVVISDANRPNQL